MRGMGRILLGGWLFLFAGMAQADAGEYRRGDFVFRIGPVPAFVERTEVAAEWPADAPGASDERWRFWLLDEQVDRRDARDEVFIDYAYEARSASLVGEAGRYQIGFNPEFQQLTIHSVELRRDGKWQDRLAPGDISLARRESGFEQDLADGTVTALIVLHDVRVRDVVRIAYSIRGSNPVLGGQMADWGSFAGRNPMLHARLRVLLDPAATPQVYRENGAPEATIVNRADAVEVSMETRGMAAVVDEEHYPTWFQPYPTAQVGPARTWREVVDWALPLYPRTQALPADLEARLREWSRLPDDRARTTAALRMVQDDVRYFGVEMGDNTHRPRAPAETWDKRFGDCKDKVYLLVTLLGRMGIDAVPALVTTSHGKAVARFVPSASVFNHVIARVRIGREVSWVDPTITLQGGVAGAYDLSDYGAALAVAPGNDRIEPIEPPRGNAEATGVIVSERYLPGENARDVRLEVRSEYRGDAADRQRRSIATDRSEDLSRRYADYYRKRLGELEPLSAPVLEDDRERNTLTISEQYLLKAPFDDESALVKALDVYADALQPTSRLPPSMVRETPLAFANPGTYRHEVELAVPERWTATFGNAREVLQSPAFAYERRSEVDGGKARLLYRIDVKQAELAPGDATPHLREVRKLQDSLSATLRFRVPATGGSAEDRQRRLQELLRNAIEEGKKP